MSDGGSFVGYEKNGLANGIGCSIDKDGLYKGDWKQGFKHGKGIQISANGTV
jgi:hypothetical protein